MWIYQDKWHRLPLLDASEFLCGASVQCDLVAVGDAEVLVHVAEHRSTVCGGCDRVAEAANAGHDTGTRETSGLSPEQQRIRDRLDLESIRRTRARKREAAHQATKGTPSSVRFVSGGLPTLGKRR